MSLNQFVSDVRKKVHEELLAGKNPSVGDYQVDLLKEAKVNGLPQMGSTRYFPEAIEIEFIYPRVGGTAIVFQVSIQTPERIVYLPVPEWVVESIWEGEIDGSYHFESDSESLVENFRAKLSKDENVAIFGVKVATARR